ncbi:MAG: farnesyl-diphosphate synthase [Gemmatales bacterium]|nr:MAG: farnesyl-diphosphate synthase [Gemmatales bacterium]
MKASGLVKKEFGAGAGRDELGRRDFCSNKATTMGGDFSETLAEKRALVDKRLDELLRPVAGCPSSLLEAMRYSVLAPGKRLRPVLVLMAAETAGGDEETALPAACAIEMVHVYSLIHDDLPAMDDDDLRRGQPSCHKKFGEALAILAGDALLTMAFQVLAEHYPATTAAHCCRELARAAGAAGMVGGQVDDLAWERRMEGTWPEDMAREQILDDIHLRKTGALFRACLRLGVWAAQGERHDGPDRDLLGLLDEFGRCFGLAFQIRDDLLDIDGSTGQTGKRVGKDAARGKLTYPVLWGRDESRRRAEALCQQAYSCLQPLGDSAKNLSRLVPYVLQRNS